MSDDEMQLVMRELDVDGGGTVGIDELQNKMRQIDSRLAEGGLGAVEEALNKIFDWIHVTRSKVVDMFNKIDQDGNGELDMHEFQYAMSEMGLELTEVEVQLVMRELDTDGEGTIGTDEFLHRMREIHRERRKAEKEASKSLGRKSAYDLKREKNKFVGSRHPATEGIDVSFSKDDDYEEPELSPRRWRPPSDQRHPPAAVGFGRSYQMPPKEFSLPDIDNSVVFPINPPSGDLSLLNKSSLRRTYQTGIRNVPYQSKPDPRSKSVENHKSWHEESLRRLSIAGNKDRRLYKRAKVQRLPTKVGRERGDPFRVSGLNTSLGNSISHQRLNDPAGIPDKPGTVMRFEHDPEGLRPRVGASVMKDRSIHQVHAVELDRDYSLMQDRSTHRFDQSLYSASMSAIQ